MLTLWHACAQWLGHSIVLPILDFLNLTQLTDSPTEIASAFMTGALQVLVISLLFRPLESLLPAERWKTRRFANLDMKLSLLMLVSLYPLFMFLILTPIVNATFGSSATDTEAVSWSLREIFPLLNTHQWLFFILYFLAYDFLYYWMHRLQHVLPWWWAMHSAHHSQRQVNCWTNDRTIYLDGIIQSFILSILGIFFGVKADEFAWFMLIGEFLQEFSHINTRIYFGAFFDKIFVDPRFHRLHHMVYCPDQPDLHNCNFGQVFTFWDILFGTALYKEPLHPCGVDDPMVDKDNQLGVIAFQVEGHKRFWGAFTCREGWKMGEVIFTQNYRPVHVDSVEAQQLKNELTINSSIEI